MGPGVSSQDCHGGKMKFICKWDSLCKAYISFSMLVPFPFLLEIENFGLENCHLVLWFWVAFSVKLTFPFFFVIWKWLSPRESIYLRSSHICLNTFCSKVFRIRGKGRHVMVDLTSFLWILKFCCSLPPLGESPRGGLKSFPVGVKVKEGALRGGFRGSL
jgi:hypothetical protein